MRVIVGMSGASAAILGIWLLEALRRVEDCETHLVVSEGEEQTIRLETNYPLAQAFGTTVTVCVGIHIDDASPADIAEMVNSTRRLTARIATHWHK